jgi:predicted membrane protein
MHFIFGPIFWGIIVTLFGISVLLNALFGISIPFGQITFALLLIYAGFSLLTNNKFHKTGCSHEWACSETAFTKTKTTASHDPFQKYNITFGNNTIDLSAINSQQTTIKVDVAFGSGTLIINPESAVTIVANSTFGSAILPDDTVITFGSHTYATHPEQINNRIFIEANVAFGNLTVTTTK